MRSKSTKTRCTLAVGLVLSGLTAWTPCLADVVWFDPSENGTQRATFADLALSYHDFIGEPTTVIDFSDLKDGVAVPDEYFARFGVTLGSTAGNQCGDWSRVYAEGGSHVRDLTGYDGSYMPDGDLVFMAVNSQFRKSPFSIEFDSPVASVGAFVGLGHQGKAHSLTLTAFDTAGQSLGEHVLGAWLWETSSRKQNYESFFAVRANKPVISRVELRDNTNAADTLLVDNVSFGARNVPEPGTVVLMTLGASLFVIPRSRRP